MNSVLNCKDFAHDKLKRSREIHMLIYYTHAVKTYRRKIVELKLPHKKHFIILPGFKW